MAPDGSQKVVSMLGSGDTTHHTTPNRGNVSEGLHSTQGATPLPQSLSRDLGTCRHPGLGIFHEPWKSVTFRLQSRTEPLACSSAGNRGRGRGASRRGRKGVVTRGPVPPSTRWTKARLEARKSFVLALFAGQGEHYKSYCPHLSSAIFTVPACALRSSTGASSSTFNQEPPD